MERNSQKGPYSVVTVAIAVSRQMLRLISTGHGRGLCPNFVAICIRASLVLRRHMLLRQAVSAHL